MVLVREPIAGKGRWVVIGLPVEESTNPIFLFCATCIRTILSSAFFFFT